MVQYYSRDEDLARRSSSGRSLSFKGRNSVEPLETAHAQCKSYIEEKNLVRLKKVIVRLRSEGRKITEDQKIKPTGPYVIFMYVHVHGVISPSSVCDNSNIHSNISIFVFSS